MKLEEVISIIGYYEEAWLEGKATIEKENKAQEAIEQVKRWESDAKKLQSMLTEMCGKYNDLFRIVEHLNKIVRTHDGSDYDARRIFDEIQETLVYKPDTNI